MRVHEDGSVIEVRAVEWQQMNPSDLARTRCLGALLGRIRLPVHRPTPQTLVVALE